MMFFYKNKNQDNKGFTLPELLVSIAIMIVITSLVLLNYGKFNDDILTTDLSYDVALSVRKAQTYGLSVKGYKDTTSGDISFNYPYGIHFSSQTSNSKTYVIFVDLPDTNGNYDGKYTASNELVESYNIQKGYYISAICSDQNDPCDASFDSVDITFKRPNPDANILVTPAPTTQPGTIVIRIKSPKNTTKDIVINTTGQISVQ